MTNDTDLLDFTNRELRRPIQWPESWITDPDRCARYMRWRLAVAIHGRWSPRATRFRVPLRDRLWVEYLRLGVAIRARYRLRRPLVDGIATALIGATVVVLALLLALPPDLRNRWWVWPAAIGAGALGAGLDIGGRVIAYRRRCQR